MTEKQASKKISAENGVWRKRMKWHQHRNVSAWQRISIVTKTIMAYNIAGIAGVISVTA